MTVEVWQCILCNTLHVQLPDGRRGSLGHWPDVCASCSLAQADEELQDSPVSVQWLVARLRSELEQERRERYLDGRVR